MNRPLKLPEVLTLEEAARYLRVPKATVQRLAEERMIPCRQVDKSWRFLKAGLQDWLRGKTVDGRAALLEQFGAFKDDETLPALRAAIYAARGRPEVGGEAES